MRLLAWLLAIGTGTALGVAAFRYPVLAVSEVEVAGLQRVAKQPVIDRLAFEGRNILTLDLDAAASSLQEDPWVRGVRFQRQLPGRVLVTVEERSPKALWQVGNRFYSVDLDGTVLEEVLAGSSFFSVDLDSPGPDTGATRGISPGRPGAPPGTTPALPVIKDLDGAAPHPGERRDAEAVALAVRLTDLVPRELGEQPRSFEYLSHGGLVVETDKGKRARFGDSADVLWKMAVWKAILKEAGDRRLKAGHVDLRFGDRPFFRP